MSSVRWPARARPAERFTATVDFPVPPFCVAIAMTLIDPYACVHVYVPTGSQAYTHTSNRYFRHYSKEEDRTSRGNLVKTAWLDTSGHVPGLGPVNWLRDLFRSRQGLGL